MIDIGFEVFFRVYALLLLFVELLGYQSVLCGYCEVAHRKMQNLPQNASTVECILLFVFSSVLNRSHIDDLAN